MTASSAFVPGSTGMTQDQIADYVGMNNASPYAQNPGWSALSDEEKAGYMSGNLSGPSPGGNVLQMFGEPDNNHPNGTYAGDYDPNYGTPSARAPMSSADASNYYASIASRAGMTPRGAPAPAPAPLRNYVSDGSDAGGGGTAGGGATPVMQTVLGGGRTGGNGALPAITDAQITSWLQANPNASDAQMRQAMDYNNVSAERMAQATGVPIAEIQRRYNAAGTQAGAPAPAPGPAPAPAPNANPRYSNTEIKGFIDNIMNGGGSPAQQAQQIRDAMSRYGVTPEQISAATGYSLQQISTFLQQSSQTTQRPPANSTDPYTINAPPVATMDPTLRTVDPRTETTQGQLESILNGDGPLMQRARALALMQMNANGTQNSSMAVGAAQTAMLDAAVPIANADAGVYGQASSDNQKYSNSADALNVSETNDMTGLTFDASQKMAQLQFQSGADERLQVLKNDTSVQLAQIEAQYKTAMQSSESARSLYSDISKNITSIMTNADIPSEEKTRLVAQQTELLRSGLAIAGAASNTDFLQILDFTGGTGAQNADGTPVTDTPGTTPPAPTPPPTMQQVLGGNLWDSPGPGSGAAPSDADGSAAAAAAAAAATSADAPGANA